MTADPAAEEWHTGKVRFTRDTGNGGANEMLVNPDTGGNEWDGVGIRFKGFFGSLRICLTGMMGECTLFVRASTAVRLLPRTLCLNMSCITHRFISTASTTATTATPAARRPPPAAAAIITFSQHRTNISF